MHFKMYRRSVVCNRLGMTSSNRREIKRRAQEVVRRLEQNPKMLERIESIIHLSASDELKTLDEIESVLIDEVQNSVAKRWKAGRRVARSNWRRSCCGRTDRKSTRLNSSHVAISYAVFCLKKKKE